MLMRSYKVYSFTLPERTSEEDYNIIFQQISPKFVLLLEIVNHSQVTAQLTMMVVSGMVFVTCNLSFLRHSSYARLLARHSGLVLITITTICVIAIICSLTLHDLPDFTDPQAVSIFGSVFGNIYKIRYD